MLFRYNIKYISYKPKLITNNKKKVKLNSFCDSTSLAPIACTVSPPYTFNLEFLSNTLKEKKENSIIYIPQYRGQL